MAKKKEQSDIDQGCPQDDPLPERNRYVVRLVVVDMNPRSIRGQQRYAVDVEISALSDITAGQVAKNRQLLTMFGGSQAIIWDVALIGQDIDAYPPIEEASRALA